MKVMSLLGFAQAAGHIVSGHTACAASLRRNRAQLVILATDAQPATKQEFRRAARKVPVVEMGTKLELGTAIGKSPRAVLCVQDKELARALLQVVKNHCDGGRRCR